MLLQGIVEPVGVMIRKDRAIADPVEFSAEPQCTQPAEAPFQYHLGVEIPACGIKPEVFEFKTIHQYVLVTAVAHPAFDPVSIIGLTDDDTPVSVSDDLTVTKGAPGGNAPPATESAPPTETQTPPESESGALNPVTPETPEIPETAAGDAAPEAETPETEKAAEEKTEEEKEGEEKPSEPTEAEQLVDELGGIDVLRAAKPLIDIAYNPEAPVSQAVEAINNFFPEDRAGEIRNEMFWQAVESEAVQDVLAQDEEAREIFAQKVFGLPYAFLEQIVEEQKPLYSDEEIGAYARISRATEKKGAEGEAQAAPTTGAEDNGDAGAGFTPAFTSILNDLSSEVDEIVAQSNLTAEQLKEFEQEWPKAFGADEQAAQVFASVRGLAQKGAEAQARQKYALLAKHSRRIAAQVTQNLQAKVKGADKRAAAGAVQPKPDSAGKTTPRPTSAQAAQTSRPRAGSLPDLDSPELDDLLRKAVEGD